MKTVNVSLVGVGGQGILLTSDILARTAALAGLSVKKSEIHGMAQRGGSVISQVRFGDKVYSPIIADGTSDLLVSFDRLETLRWRHLLAPNGKVLMNEVSVTPITVSSGLQKDVDDLEGKIKAEYGDNLITIDAMKIAQEVGNIRTMNMIIAGALSTLTHFEVDTWKEAMRQRLPAKLVDMNLRAFDLGRAAM